MTIKHKEKTLLEELLELNITKVEALNRELASHKKLAKGQYGELVEKNGLKEVFRCDVFFALIVAFRNYNVLTKEFASYFKNHEEVFNEFTRLRDIYGKRLFTFFEHFEKNLIEDDRVGYTGEHLDLSKSVYRTIKMRSSKRIDLTLHKYAEVKRISSESPIIIVIIQSIDPQIVINIWDAYSLDEYVKNVWRITNDNIIRSWLFQGIAGAAGYDAMKWLRWKLINGSKYRKEKTSARVAFKDSLEEKRNERSEDGIQEALTQSVIASNEYLRNEVEELRKELKKIKGESSILIDETKEIKDLEERIERLENIEVEVEF